MSRDRDTPPAHCQGWDLSGILSYCTGHYRRTVLPILEAFAASLPVIATNWRGIPDLVVNEQNGFLFPPHATEAMAKSILRLAENSVLYDRLSINAKSDFDTSYTMGTFEASIVAYFNQLE